MKVEEGVARALPYIARVRSGKCRQPGGADLGEANRLLLSPCKSRAGVSGWLDLGMEWRLGRMQPPLVRGNVALRRASVNPNNNQTTGAIQGTRWRVGGRKEKGSGSFSPPVGSGI